MSRRRQPRSSEPWRASLDVAVRLAPGRCSEEEVARLVAVRDHVEERLGLGDALTVAALAGGTGVGKSALTNQLAGAEVVVEGVRRPTTGAPVAVAAVLDESAKRLLDWLDIDDRRQVPGVLPEGLVLVDLPDHDSVVRTHRRTSERLAARVDVLVVVVDAIKYARADLHEGALAPFTAHAEVVTVVLNRSDELPTAALARIEEDLAHRLTDDGLAGVTLLATSARTGAGVEALRSHLAEVAVARTAAIRRLAADVAVVAGDILPQVPALPSLELEVAPLVEVAPDAADVHRALGVALLEQRRLARRSVRSPLARAVRAPAGAARWVGRGLGVGRGRSAPPPDRASERSQARLAARLEEALGLAATAGPAHTALEAAIERAAALAAPAVVAEVRRAAAQVTESRRGWWSVAAGLRGLAEATALVGILWQLVLGAVVWLGLPALPRPMLTDELSWPVALLLAGVVVRVLLGWLTRLALAVSSRRLRTRARRRLHARLGEVVSRELLAPYEQEVTAVAELRAALTALR
jgi:GTP-binding protein EngB required for normal cell division